ncbi:hypothetical protein B296_00003185 [Ensete ventricosum]|uniref:Thioredoxin domain-containing protein n=1 Tax=Ensete ventricosum TaxID=4639 RepID=A0A427BBK6_ENSVE|nr:hypothetical protein B296_00003185 [Ensete ventricosum]
MLVALLFFSALLCIGAPANALYSPSSPVVQLNPSNFKSKVSFCDDHFIVLFCCRCWLVWIHQLTMSRRLIGSGLELERGRAGGVLCSLVRPLSSSDPNLGESGHRSPNCIVPTYRAQLGMVRYAGIEREKKLLVGDGSCKRRDQESSTNSRFSLLFFLPLLVKALLKERLSGKASGDSSEKSEPSASVVLTSQNFDELVIKSKDLWIVEFFAPWYAAV